MKRFVLYTLLTCMTVLSGGCLGTPGYTGEERSRMIGRTWSYDMGQAVDDWDSFWLLRPPSRMTRWNVR